MHISNATFGPSNIIRQLRHIKSIESTEPVNKSRFRNFIFFLNNNVKFEDAFDAFVSQRLDEFVHVLSQVPFHNYITK